MTIDEAIEILKENQLEHYHIDIDEYKEIDMTVRNMAIQALEKQIPKKPLFGTVHNDTTYHCSSCKKFIGFYDTRIYEYCHNCGQKLDWQTKL